MFGFHGQLIVIEVKEPRPEPWAQPLHPVAVEAVIMRYVTQVVTKIEPAGGEKALV